MLEFVDSDLYFVQDKNNFINPLLQVGSGSVKKSTGSGGQKITGSGSSSLDADCGFYHHNPQHWPQPRITMNLTCTRDKFYMPQGSVGHSSHILSLPDPAS